MATSSETLPVAAIPARIVEEGASLRRNVAFSIVDYLVQPVLMVVTARYFVKILGVPVFGIWILVLAIIGSSGSICTGFGDAALKYVATMRGRLDHDGVARVIATSAILNVTLGVALATAFYFLSPWAATHIFHLSETLSAVFIAAIRIGGCILIIRSLSFVFIGALRAFERYQQATQITVAARVAAAIAGILLVWRGFGVVGILTAVLVCEFAALAMLSYSGSSLWKQQLQMSQLSDWRAITSFGFFNWVQAIAGTLFSQADRLLVAALLGPSALGYYGVCVQATQPIHGLTAAGCNVLFPHLSTRLESHGKTYLRSVIGRTFRLTLLCVLGLALPLILFSGPILSVWMGRSFSQHAATTLSLVALSFCLLALNIPGHYALMALGEVRFLTVVNVAGCCVSLVLAWLLIPKFGITGAALGRLAYGPLTWLLYLRLGRATETAGSH